MKVVFCRILFILSMISCPSLGFSLPDLYNPAASNGKYPILTIYKDHLDPNRYYYPIDSIEIAKIGNDHKFSLSHWGITSPDIDGSGANLTVSVRPVVNMEFYKEAFRQIKRINPAAVFSPLPILDSNYEIIMDDRFVYGSRSKYLEEASEDDTASGPVSDPVIDIVLQENDPGLSSESDNSKQFALSGGHERISGGSATSTQAFTIALERLGARVLASQSGSGGGAIVIRYNYKVIGVGPRLHARIIVDWRKVSEHFQTEIEGSFYSGAVSAGMMESYKKLKNVGGISIEILNGGTAEADALEAYVREVYEILTKAYIDGTGLFADRFESTPAPSLPKGAVSKAAGWGVSGTAFSEKIDQEVQSVFVIKREETVDQWFSVGLSVGQSCHEGSLLFYNLTAGTSNVVDLQRGIADVNQSCIVPSTLKSFRDRVNQCVIDATKSADELEQNGVDNKTVNILRKSYVDACKA